MDREKLPNGLSIALGGLWTADANSTLANTRCGHRSDSAGSVSCNPVSTSAKAYPERDAHRQVGTKCDREVITTWPVFIRAWRARPEPISTPYCCPG
jgi:hypothetical protein